MDHGTRPNCGMEEAQVKRLRAWRAASLREESVMAVDRREETVLSVENIRLHVSVRNMIDTWVNSRES